MADIAKKKLEQAQAKQIIRNGKNKKGLERAIAAATLQEKDGITLKERQTG